MDRNYREWNVFNYDGEFLGTVWNTDQEGANYAARDKFFGDSCGPLSYPMLEVVPVV